jgi:hypothetical protein
MSVVRSDAFEEVFEFLLSSPTPQQVMDFHASDEAQARVRELLTANGEGLLTPEEKVELEHLEEVNRFVRAFKIYTLQRMGK